MGLLANKADSDSSTTDTITIVVLVVVPLLLHYSSEDFAYSFIVYFQGQVLTVTLKNIKY